MTDLMAYDRLEGLYRSFLIIRKQYGYRDYICKAGGIDVTVTADKGDHCPAGKGDWGSLPVR